MISIVKKKNKISRDLLSKIEWACRLNSIKFEHQIILEGCLRIIVVIIVLIIGVKLLTSK